jgi:hypothetical protein
MKAYDWSMVTGDGLRFYPPPEGPHRFIPLFNTREQAVAWAGSEDLVAPVVAVAQGLS